jgi:hypothetical protein
MEEARNPDQQPFTGVTGGSNGAGDGSNLPLMDPRLQEMFANLVWQIEELKGRFNPENRANGPSHAQGDEWEYQWKVKLRALARRRQQGDSDYENPANRDELLLR